MTASSSSILISPPEHHRRKGGSSLACASCRNDVKGGVRLRWICLRGKLRSVGEEELRERIVGDEKLLRRAEKALTQIKVAQGLSEDHAGVLAALRIRLKGDAGKSLEDLIDAAGDLGGPELEKLLE